MRGSVQYKQFSVSRSLIFLSMLYLVTLIVSVLMANKLIVWHHIILSAAIFVYPLSYFCGDVIAEVYGYKTSRVIIWCGLAGQLLFAALCIPLLHLASPAFWHYQSDYHYVISPLFRIAMACALSVLAGDFLNSYLLTKWKVMLHGKRFWLRSLGSTSCAELIDTVLAYSAIFLIILPFKTVLEMIIIAYVIKCVFVIIGVLPATWLVAYLKRKEGVDVYDTHTNFNPFKLEL